VEELKEIESASAELDSMKTEMEALMPSISINERLLLARVALMLVKSMGASPTNSALVLVATPNKDDPEKEGMHIIAMNASEATAIEHCNMASTLLATDMQQPTGALH
jgi:hypothetical protein